MAQPANSCPEIAVERHEDRSMASIGVSTGYGVQLPITARLYQLLTETGKGTSLFLN